MPGTVGDNDGVIAIPKDEVEDTVEECRENIVKEVNPNDQQITIGDIKICLDTAWLDLLDGAEIDFVEEKATNISH